MLRLRIGVCYIQKAITVELSLWPVSSSLCFLLMLHFAFVKILLLANNKLQEIPLGYFDVSNCKYLSRLYVQCSLRDSKVCPHLD